MALRRFAGRRMEKLVRKYIIPVIALIAFAACSKEEQQEEHDVQFCVQEVWHAGRALPSTRALSATDLLASGTGDIAIDTEDYPSTIAVSCSDGIGFTLTKGSSICSTHTDYYNYTAPINYKDNIIKRNDLTFTATATIDEGDKLEGIATKDDLMDKHLRLTLHHTKALLRFAFRVDARYNSIRYIKITNINLNGNDITLADKVLSTSDQFIAYTYIDPTLVTVSKENTFRCTYNIYDKDTDFTASEEEIAKHITRPGIEARNTFVLGSLKKADGVTTVFSIKAGYYYDLQITLNPDYLYVLSEHDNKHLTIK